MEYQESEEVNIQRYLDGDLGEDEKSAFEAKMEADALLQEQVGAYRLLGAGIRFQKREENWEKIRELESDTASTFNLRRILFSNWQYAAAGLAVLLAATFFIYKLLITQEDLQQLYAENFSPYPALIHAPVRGVEEPKTVEGKAYAAYSNEEYEEAIDFFQIILKEKEDPFVRFYMGNAFLVSGKYKEAIIAFESVLQADTILIDQSKWYLGLSFLAEGDKENALIVLKELSAGSSTYSKKAESIIYQL